LGSYYEITLKKFNGINLYIKDDLNNIREEDFFIEFEDMQDKTFLHFQLIDYDSLE
jgi:hypothetical protein